MLYQLVEKMKISRFILDLLPYFVLFGMFFFAQSCARAQQKESTIDKSKWKDILDDKEYRIMVNGATEYPWTSPLNSEKRNGVYVSPATGDTLFKSTDKFNSRTGWPSFDDATDKVALGPAEQGGYEVIEKSTGLHLGHLFLYEGFTDKGKRYCINGSALKFIPEQ